MTVSMELASTYKEYILENENLYTFSKAFLETRGKELLKAHWGQRLPDEVERKETEDIHARPSTNSQDDKKQQQAILLVESMNLALVKKLLQASQTINFQLQNYASKHKTPERTITAMAVLLKLNEEETARFVELFLKACTEVGIDDFVANPAEGFDQNLFEATRNQQNAIAGKENWDEDLKAEYFENFMFPKLQSLSIDREQLSTMTDVAYVSFVKLLIKQHDMFVKDMYYIQGVDKIWNPIHKTLLFLITRVSRILHEQDDKQLRSAIWYLIAESVNGAFGKTRDDQIRVFEKIMSCIDPNKMNVEDVVYKYATRVLMRLLNFQMTSPSFKKVKDEFNKVDGAYWKTVNRLYYSMDYRVLDDVAELRPMAASIQKFTLHVLKAIDDKKNFMKEGHLFWQDDPQLNLRMKNILLLTVANSVSGIPVTGDFPPSFETMCAKQFWNVVDEMKKKAKKQNENDWIDAWSPDRVSSMTRRLAAKFANAPTSIQNMPYTSTDKDTFMAIEGILKINEDMFNTLWNTVCGFADKQSDIFWEGNSSHQLAIIKDILRGGVGLQDSEISTISQEMNVMVQDFWKKIRRKAFIPTRNDEIVYLTSMTDKLASLQTRD